MIKIVLIKETDGESVRYGVMRDDYIIDGMTHDLDTAKKKFDEYKRNMVKLNAVQVEVLETFEL
ncbi:MAG: hypothetical protein ACYDHY_19690 [Acidiferrobacterales bacterium]